MRRQWLKLFWAALAVPAVAAANPNDEISRPIVPLASAVASGHVGNYVHSEREMVAELWLRADGIFEYGLTVGALDESARGRWTAQGNRITLVNDRVPVPPTITAGPARRSDTKRLELIVTTPSGNGVQAVDLVVGFDSGSVVEGYTQSYGWMLPADEKREPLWVVFSMSSFGLRSPRFPIDVRAANVRNFILTPNDIGVVNFADVKVTADNAGVTIVRDGQPMRFEKQDER